MSNLLEFQHTILTAGKAVYSIETGELNPAKLKATENEETITSIPIQEYGVRNLREFILKNSQVLAANGDILKGEVKNEKVILTVLNKVN